MKRIALITGGGSGIGFACAKTLADNDYHVVIAGRRVNVLEQAADEIGSSNCTPFRCDVSVSSDVDALFEGITSAHGRLDVLFNNAGINVPAAPIGDLKTEDILSVISVNFAGAFLCARGAFRMMRSQDPQGGRIINNGSISAHAPRPGSAPYTSTKHAITGLTRSISLDGRPYDIACGQIDIGNASSEMTERMQSGVPQADLSIKPEPVMEVQHVADAVLQMANLPLDANIQFMTIMATKMPFVGRG